jgi:DNA-binding MarR family transcriptional regulator
MRTLLADKEVYPGQQSLLFSLSELDGQSQRELAESLNIKAATLTVMISRMEKTGFVERRPDPEDQRISRVFLTDRGREIYREVQEAMNVMESLCFDNFTEDEKKLFGLLLIKMERNINRGDELV